MTRHRITPGWLRPVVATAVIGLHAGVFLGAAWPDAEAPAVTAPIAVQVVPQGEIATTAAAPREAQVAEVTAVETAASDAQAGAAKAVEATEIKSEQPAEAQAIAVPVLTPDATVQAVEDAKSNERPVPEPPRRPKRAVEHNRGKTGKKSAAQASSRASAVAHDSHAEAVTGSIASANYRSIVAAELNRRKFYPPSARASGIKGVVVVNFTVGSNGRVQAHAIVRSSGQPMLDEAARQMMAAISLPPPPGGVFRATVPIRFDIGH